MRVRNYSSLVLSLSALGSCTETVRLSGRIGRVGYFGMYRQL